MDPLAVTFHGTDRYELLRVLGHGGMGVVYEALDRHLGTTIALKVLPLVSPERLLRFKREFRVASSLSHPNLVRLGELVRSGDHWFFTMELVRGVDVLEYVRGGAAHALPSGPRTIAWAHAATAADDPALCPEPIVVHGANSLMPALGDEQRLRSCMRGLASALSALHDAGCVHRDVKPSNVLVTDAGRAVLLDFGLASVSAADSTLFVASPSGSHVLRCLGGASWRYTAPYALGTHGVQTPLLGREEEWARLAACLADVKRTGRALAVVISGESGVGKSTLAHAFIEAQASEAGAEMLTFFSRCYERELVPYKAVDGLLDSVAHSLRHAPLAFVKRVLPERAGVIAQVFPVLARVEALSQATLPDRTIDLREVRAWLFSAVRELFKNIANERLVIAFVDDLHWADNDSMALLSELLRDLDAPRMLLIGTLRTKTQAPFEGKLFAGEVNEQAIHLGNLSPQAARTLALRLAVEHSDPTASQRLAEESGGHPLFLRELTEAAAGAAKGRDITLEGVLQQRVTQLSDDARHMLNLLAVSSTPIEATVLKEASTLSGAAYNEALHALRANRLVHAAGEIFDDRLDISHDRIRRAARALLAADDVEALHRALASALELRGDPVLSATHWREAREPERAAHHYASAGKLALDALAFGDAASHLRAALSLGTWDNGERTRLLAALGDALSNAGRGAEAAQQYRLAAAVSSESDAMVLKRRACEELVRSGYLDEAFKVASEVLSQADLHPARAPLYALLLQRSLLRVRGLRFRARSAEEISEKELARIDLCWSISTGLVVTDTFQGAYFQARGLALSLRAGDTYRIARSIAAEGAYNASRGARQVAHAHQLLQIADELAERTKDPRAIGTVLLMRGIALHLQGNFAPASELLHQASTTFRERCTGMFWERDAARQFGMECAFYLGDLAAVRNTVIAGLRDATERGAMYSLTNLRTGLANAVWLLEDQPEEALTLLRHAMGNWSVRGFHVQHWYALIAETHVALYEKRGDDAIALLDARWPDLAGSHLLRVNHSRVVAEHLRGRAALCAATFGRSERSAEHLRTVHRAARSLKSEDFAWAHALGSLLELGAHALTTGTVSEEQCVALAAQLEQVNLRVYALSLRAVALGGSDALAQQGAKAPGAFAAMLVPGFTHIATPEPTLR